LKFLVLWEHFLDTPEGAGNALDVIKQDMQKGIIKEWGAFPTTGRGFVICEVDNEGQAFLEMQKYRKFNIHCLSAEPFLTVAELEKLLS
jgi:hypothetical protein